MTDREEFSHDPKLLARLLPARQERMDRCGEEEYGVDWSDLAQAIDSTA